ncbi:MAG: filamentous hemagglutinin N-terminal domain-containing protein, partial [Gammaproteobacteria bacterium]
MRKSTSPKSTRRALALALGCTLGAAAGTAGANPLGPQVVNGGATFANPAAGVLEVTNTPGAIINWQSFGIGASETTRFIQQSAQSAVLNRVVGGVPSEILGNLLSNGRVFLVNPNGILFGRNAVVDTAGLVASTLSIQDADFISGRLKFDGGPESGAIRNEGFIKAAPGGNVLVIAPTIENTGIIQADGGKLMLAAGRSVTLVSLDSDYVTFEVQAPSDQVLNLGELLARGGAARIFAGSIRQAGVVSADSVGVDAAGVVELRASSRVALESASRTTASGGTAADGGSVIVEARSAEGTAPAEIAHEGTVDASGVNGGSVTLAGDLITSTGTVSARGGNAGGAVSMTARDSLLLSGMSRVRVDGGSGQGGSATLDGGMNLNASTIVEASGDRGGTIHVLGDSVQLVGASLDARGEHGGGDVRIGGGRAGGEGLKASNVTAVDRLTLVRADATGDGDGGTAVLWSAGDTHFSGTITARGGMTGGDGGLIEVSGRSIYNLGRIDLSAVAGNGGTLVLDPVLITIQAGSIINTTGFADPTNSEGSSFGSDFNCFAAGSITSCGSGADRILFYVPLDDVNGVADSGAVYLFDLQTGALVSSLIGTHAGDQVGAGGLYDFDECCLSLPGMPDGTVVLSHPFYNNDGGALTPFNVISGMGIGTAVSDGSVPGVAANSIVGNPGDFITSSFFDVDALPGKTVMFNEDALGGRGAVTVLNSASLTFAATGGFGMVSAANSLVGVATTDHVGSAGAFQISSGNYYIRSPDFNSFGGALTFFNAGTTPVGTVSNANSILGNAGDQLASGFFQYLDANTLAMATPDFGGGRGAVTVVNPTTGQFKAGGGFGFIGSGNSLVGSATTDAVGNGGVTFLGGNGYYIESPDFNSLGGALTFISPTVIPVGVVSASNSIMGNAGEGLGSGGIVNSIVGVQLLRTPGFGVDLGAVTAIDPATGQFKTGGFGFIGATNSLVGATSGDQVGSDGFIQIGTSAGYIYSPSWDGGRGALTFFSSTALPVGIVSDGVVTPTANSITGAFGSDCLGCRGIFTPFTFGGVAGRVVILTDTFNVDAGAITVTDATTGEFAVGGGFGNVGGANSLIGGGGDRLGSSGVEWAFDEFGSITGTFVKSPLFNGSAGAFTFVSANPVDPVPFGAVNGANGASIFGANPSDRIGDVSFGGTFDTFSVPGYTVILSPHYNGDRGAITVLDSTTGRFAASALFGMVDASGCPGASSTCNSAVGSVAGDLVGDGGLFPDFNGRAFVFSPGWNSSGGALTFLEPGAVAPAVIPLGQVGTGNSIVGAPGDLLGSNGVDMFSLSGLTIVLSPFAAFNAGAITVLDSATGQFAVGGGFGAISTSNSLVGVIDSFASLPEDRIGSGDIEVLPSGTAMVTSPFFNESAGALTFIRSGSVPFGLLTTASPTAFSIAGDQPGAHLGSNAGGSDFIYTSEDLESLISAQGGGFFFPTRFDGDLVVLSPDAFNGKGAITVLDDTTGQFTVSGTYGALDVSGCPGAGATCNSLAGATANATVQGDHLGSGGIVGLASGHVLVRSLEFNKGAGTVGGGALTFLDNAAAPLTGIADGTNSIIGANGANLLGSLTIDQFTLFGKLILRNSNYDSGRGVGTGLDAAAG